MTTDIAMGAAFDQAVDDLNALISRRFAAAPRLISVEAETRHDGAWYFAELDGRTLFPPTPELDTVIRFVRAFAIQTEGVEVDEDSVEWQRAERAGLGYSVRVPSNVVPIHG